MATTTNTGPEENHPQRLGPYQLVRRIASGTTCDLYLAMRPGLSIFSRYLVLKRLHDRLASDAELVEAFLAGGKLAAQLDHPNIVQVYEAGSTREGYYVAMEYIPGRNLHTLLEAAAGPLEPGVALYIMDRICEGLASTASMVHGAVNPGHVLLDFSGTVKICGFASIRALSDVQGNGESQASDQMAPERLRGAPVDHRSDIYGLGLLLFAMTTGHSAVTGNTIGERQRTILDGRLRDPREVKPDYPQRLTDIYRRATARDPDDRYPDVAAMLSDLLEFRQRGTPVASSQLSRLMKRHFTADRMVGPAVAAGHTPERSLEGDDVDEDAPTQVRGHGQQTEWTGLSPEVAPSAAPEPSAEIGGPITIEETEVDPDPPGAFREPTLTGDMISLPPLEDEPSPPLPRPQTEDARHRARAWARLEAQLMSELEPRGRGRLRPVLAGLLVLVAVGALGALGLYANRRAGPAGGAAPADLPPAPTVAPPPQAADAAPPPRTEPDAAQRALPDAATAATPDTFPAPGPAQGGRLRMRVTPPVDVVLDGKELGRTPFLVDVPPGKHKLVMVNKQLGISIVRRVNILAGDLTVFRWTLTRGTLKVTADGPAKVSVDGIQRGTAPLEIPLWEGVYRVTLTDENGVSRTTREVVRPGKTTTVDHRPGR